MLAWLAVQRTDSPLAIAMLGVARFSPFLFAGPFLGLLADRFPRLRIMRMSRLALICAMGAMVALLATDTLALWHMYLYTLVSGLLWNMEMPARRAYIGGVVRGASLIAAVALDMLAWTFCQVAGNNAAGVLLSVIKPVYLYPGAMALIGVSALPLVGLPILSRRPAVPVRASVLADLAGGLRYVRRNRELLGVLAVIGIANLTGFCYAPLIPVFSTSVLGTGPKLLGLLLSADGIGALVMSFVLIVVAARLRRPALTMLLGAVGMNVLAIVFSLSTWYLASFACLVVLGMFVTVFGTMHGNLVLALVPWDYRGRVIGIQMFVFGAFPLGSLIVGVLADFLGPGMAVRVMAAAGLAVFVGIRFWFPELWQKPEPGPAPARI